MNSLDYCYLGALSQALKGNLEEAFDLKDQAEQLLEEGFSFSEEQDDKYPYLEAAVETLLNSYDFARCMRPDGSFYGTRGRCKKGTDAGKAPTQGSPEGKYVLGTPTPRQTSNQYAHKRPGPLHKEVSQAREEHKYVSSVLKERQTELDRLVRAYKVQEKVVKTEKSRESRERLKRVEAAVKLQERAVRRTEREAEKAKKKWVSLDKKNQRALMSPERRALERELNNEIVLRG